MSLTEPNRIIRIAAKGDGVLPDGTHVSGAAPGDIILPDGAIAPGPHHAEPPCRHFGRCGGCDLQHCDDSALAEFVRSRVVNAAEGQQIAAEEVLPTHLSPQKSRRRATLHAASSKKGAIIGFRERGSHKIVDMRECHVLCPPLFACVDALRSILNQREERFATDIELTLVDQGIDCAIKNLDIDGLAQTEAILDFARGHKLARLTLDVGFGPEAVWEPEPVTVTLAGTPVAFPSGSFLQATQDGEDTLVRDAQDYLERSEKTADLFSGLGTFAFALAKGRQIVAVEAAREPSLACRGAANAFRRPIDAVHRDLFRNPLQLDELKAFDAVLLDPPRAGARNQIDILARSSVERIAYISCNPSSWARDARRLVDGGYALISLRPIGQFRWSTHVELSSLFVRAAMATD
ncbi:MAG: class I SAM-dependent RNA methyltransferase [Pontixanthobacter sp.]